MSLFGRLAIFTTLVCAAALAAALWFSIQSTRTALGQQLRQDAQKAAYRVRASLNTAQPPAPGTRHYTQLQTWLDQSSLTQVRIRSAAGDWTLTRTLPAAKSPVPPWFKRWFKLAPGRASIALPSTKRGAATLAVDLAENPAYAALWQTAYRNGGWFLGLAATATLLFSLLLRRWLRPLAAVESHALTIAGGDFITRRPNYQATEFQRVTLALNRMSGKIQHMLAVQTELAEKMRARAYEDAVTGLQNRRSFEERLDHLVHSAEEFQVEEFQLGEFQLGGVILLRLDNLDTVNLRGGFPLGDALLQEAAQVLRDLCPQLPDSNLARIGGADFAVASPHSTPEEALSLASALCHRMRQLHTGNAAVPTLNAHAGIAYAHHGVTASPLLAAADLALRTAQCLGQTVHLLPANQDPAPVRIRTAGQWRQLLRRRIDAAAIALHFQPVRTCARYVILHHEALARIDDEHGGLIPAGAFMPMAERHQLGEAIDRIVVHRLLAQLDDPSPGRVAVNLSAGSIGNPAFHAWLVPLLQRHARAAQRLIFETSEYAAVNRLDMLQEMIAACRPWGCQFALDHLGSSSPSPTTSSLTAVTSVISIAMQIISSSCVR